MLRNNLLPLHLAALHKQFASIIISIRILYGGQFCYFYIHMNKYFDQIIWNIENTAY